MQAVTDHIRAHALRVGDALPSETHFAAELLVSRPVVREAFGALAALRLIDVGNGRRARVAAIDGVAIASSLDHAISTAQITVTEVWDVRRTIELRTAALAAASRTDAEAATIMDLADAMARGQHDSAIVTRNDIAFHEAVARASHNALFRQIVSSFGPLMELTVAAAWATRTDAAQRIAILERHKAVAQAIHMGDPAAAAAAMDAHFDATVGNILRGRTADPTVSPHAGAAGARMPPA
jgi:DNA-binding FadR family transcriptional regulator